MEFGILGTSIWQQNQALLETLTIDREEKAVKLTELKEALGLEELIYLATCNRVEFMYTAREKTTDQHLLHRLIDFFFSDGTDINFFPNDFYHYTGKEAITHLFRTVSSLESLVVGETQITGQFKDAYEESLTNGLVGIYLNKLAKEALLVSKKIKRETALGEGAQSMASLAADELKKILSKNDSNIIALVGSGEMTEKFARYIRKEKLGTPLFVNRSIQKIEWLAEQFEGSVMSLDDFIANPPEVAAIMSATAAKSAVFNCAFLAKFPYGEKPLICIDLAIPRDFCAEFDLSKNCTLIDIPKLKSQANNNLRRKFVEASKANQIIKESVHKFISDDVEVSIKPIFANTYKESVELAKNALQDLFAKKLTTVSKEDQKAIVNLVTKLIGHSSFQPSKLISNHLASAQNEFNMDTLPSSNKEVI